MKTIDQSFIHENLMGPNVALLFDELCSGELPPDAGSRICDLGCGAGLSSLLAAETTHGTVYAVDSWNTPEKNRERFDAFDCGSRIKAIQADAPDLPFEQHYFDALFSLDSYNYFGCGLGIIDKIANFVKSGGIILLSVPGLVCELNDDMMKILGRSWTRDQMDYIRTIDYWEGLFGQSSKVGLDKISPMKCYEQAWKDWLTCDNEYAQGDRAAMESGGFALMNLIQIKLTVL